MIIRTKHNKKWEIVEIESFVGDKYLGECRPETIQIVLKKSDPKKYFTLIHEIIHAIDIDNDINLTETQVRKLELAIERFMRLNKPMIKKLNQI